jgi:predicted transcriptional regulator of viral defense system
MLNKEFVLKLLKENNNILKSQDLKKNNIDNKLLIRMMKEGLIERVDKGLYIDANTIEDEFYIFQHKCKKAVFSHSTALYFHDLSDRSPIRYMVTVPSGYNSRLLKDEKYVFSYIKKDLYELGIIKVKTIYQNEVYCYNIERTICDIVRDKDKIDPALFVDAMRRYSKLKDNNYGKLYEYAEKLNVKQEIVKYMEVL